MTSKARPKRPLWLSILALLSMAGGAFGVVVTIALIGQLPNNPQMQEVLSIIGLPPILLLAALFFVCGLAIAAGIGMWRGTKWGWYLGTFYLMYSIVNNISALISIPFLLNSIPEEQLDDSVRDPLYYVMKHSLRIFISITIYRLFFNENVRDFFGLPEPNQRKVVLVELGICIGIAIVINILALIIG